MSEFPNIEQLREARSQVGERAGNSWRGAHFLVRQEVVEAADFLLSVLDEGGRLVVEAPCEHGVFHDSCDQLVCGHDHLLADGWYFDARAECWCPGGSRRVVWPTDKEEE